MKKMKCSKRLFIIFGLFSSFFLLFPLFIYAYIDPGTGSYIIQIAIAAFIGISIALRIFWGKLKAFLANIFQRKRQNK